MVSEVEISVSAEAVQAHPLPTAKATTPPAPPSASPVSTDTICPLGPACKCQFSASPTTCKAVSASPAISASNCKTGSAATPTASHKLPQDAPPAEVASP